MLGDIEVPLAPRVPVGAAVRRLRKIATFNAFLSALGVLGLVTVGIPTYVNLALRRDLGLSTSSRSFVHAFTALGGIAGLAIGGRYGDRLFGARRGRCSCWSPAPSPRDGLLLPLSLYMPNAAAYAAVDIVSGAVIATAMVPALSLLTSVTPYRLRSIALAAIGLCVAVIGGLGGVLIVGTLSNRLGPRTALTIALPPISLVGAALLARGARWVDGDIAAVAREIDDEHAAASHPTGPAPLLEIRGLEVSYGSMQVLFDVDLEVREGEVLALLGTNGAGKSTLLRAISGLSHADRGLIRLDGDEITFLSPRERVARGIVQVPGGQAVLPGLTVRDNLLAGAYTYVWDAARVEAAMGRAIDRFPILGERLDQLAGTLSGGEQQMLALAKALLLEPRLLIIDELSLGSPQRRRAAARHRRAAQRQGLTIVIVEQSLNVALSLADRAVFMEKGAGPLRRAPPTSCSSATTSPAPCSWASARATVDHDARPVPQRRRRHHRRADRTHLRRPRRGAGARLPLESGHQLRPRGDRSLRRGRPADSSLDYALALLARTRGRARGRRAARWPRRAARHPAALHGAAPRRARRHASASRSCCSPRSSTSRVRTIGARTRRPSTEPSTLGSRGPPQRALHGARPRARRRRRALALPQPDPATASRSGLPPTIPDGGRARAASARRRVSTLVWVLAGLLATLTAVLVSPLRGTILGVPAPALGPAVLLRALAAALVGRLTSLPIALRVASPSACSRPCSSSMPARNATDLVLFGVVLVLVLAAGPITEGGARTTGLARRHRPDTAAFRDRRGGDARAARRRIFLLVVARRPPLPSSTGHRTRSCSAAC